MIKKKKPVRPNRVRSVELKESELAVFAKDVMNSVSSHLVVLNGQGTIVTVNTAWTDFGRKNAASRKKHLATIGLGVNYLEVLQNSRGPNSHEAGPAYIGIRKVLSGKLKRYTLEYPCHSPKEKRWFMMTVLPLHGKRRGVVITHHNITESKLLVEEQKEKQQLLQRVREKEREMFRILHFSPGGLYTILISPDGKGRLTFASPKFRSLIGPSVREMKKDAFSFYKWIHPEDVGRVMESTRRAVENPCEWNEEFRLDCSPREEVTLEMIGRTTREKDGSVLWLGVMIDITERKKQEETRKKAEQLLRESEAKYRILSENIETPLATVDLSGRFLIVNKAFAEIFGREAADMIGKTWSETMDPAMAEERLQIMAKVLSENRSISDETRIEINGNVRWYRRSFRPVLIDGRISHMLVIGIDITDQKKESQQQQQYASELEHRVAERTRELQESLSKERELTDLKSKFISTTSHEFRTPLSTISLSAGFIRRYLNRAEPDVIKERIENIEKQVSHMSLLLDDILLIGKTEAGKYNVNITQLLLKPFMRGIVHEVEESRKSHTVDIQIQCDTDWFFTDEKLIRNIVINLLTNAIKFSPGKKKVLLTITCDAEYYTFVVRDYGLGIPRKDQEELFQPFYRGANAHEIQGTGLGLSIVKKAVDLLSGTIRFESKEGEGTTFIITLPLTYGQENTGG